MKVSAIVAMSENRVIGVKNQLPWKISEDLKRFRALTTGHPIVMGRKTYESIGRVLPHRPNWIISRQPDYRVDGALTAKSLDDVLRYYRSSSEEVFIIGGGEIYQSSLPLLDRIYLTLVHTYLDGDAFFPEIPADTFVEKSREPGAPGSEYSFSFILLEKKHSSN